MDWWSGNGIFAMLLYVSFFVSPLSIAYIWVRRLIAQKKSAGMKHGWRQQFLYHCVSEPYTGKR